MRRATIALLGGLLLLFANGCAMLELVESRDLTGYKARFTDTQKQYTRLVRWNEFARASEAVEPEQRSAYLEALRKLGEIRFTDYEAEAPAYDAEAQTATVFVRYSAYHANTLSAVTLLEEQRWTRDLASGDWHVDHEGAPLVEAKGVGAR
jgi:hypothetical protein